MEQFGKYQLIQRIGVGGMAEVFLANTAVAQGLVKQLVIKKIHRSHANSREFVSMFVDEAKIALSLNHPNIVQVFDFGQVGQTFFLAMEYVEGIDLFGLMRMASSQTTSVPFGVAAYLMQEVCKGLDYAHRKADDYGVPLGIVHRDISPHNVLLSLDGAVKIVDFGIARTRELKEADGTIKGKFGYMAPEQARGLTVDRRADVFAAGVVLFELVCGRPLFPGKGKRVLELAKTGAAPRPRDENPLIPSRLEEIILKALSFDRGDRFQTARDLQTALGRFQFDWDHEESTATTDSGVLAQFVSTVMRTAGPVLGNGNVESIPAVNASMGGQTAGMTKSVVRPEVQTPPVVDKTIAGKRATHVASERKPVFAVHGVLVGLSNLEEQIGATSAGNRLSAFWAICSDIAFKHGAVVREASTDAVRMLVGVPTAGEDDASNALTLARALVEALDALGEDVEPDLRLAVGIERGVALVTRFRDGEFAYALEGELLPRVQSLATGAQGAEILVSKEVYLVTRDDWNLEPVTVSQGLLGGAYRLRGRKERHQRLSERSARVELFGRDLELKALRDAYQDTVARSKGHLVVVTGEQGVGKRSLVNALLASIPAKEAAVIRATARVATRLTPFGMVADFARDAMGLAEGAEPKEIQKRVESLTRVLWLPGTEPEDFTDLVDAACLLFGLRREGVFRMDPDLVRRRVRRVVLRMQEVLWPTIPIVVVGEKMHWSDEQSIAFTRDLALTGHERGILVVLTFRSEDSEAWQEIADQHIHLSELDTESRHRLIRERFVPGQDVAELARLILPRTGGNPYFINEVLDNLVETGVLARKGGDGGLLFRQGQELPVSVPPTIEALLATRIDRLDPSHKRTLMHASVLGSRFRNQELFALVERDCTASLKALVKTGLLCAHETEHSFPNGMTMTIAYLMLPVQERERLHLRAARNAKTNLGYRKGQDDAFIARHLELGGDVDACAHHYTVAAKHALRVGSTQEALTLLERALRCLPPDRHEQRFDIHQCREEAWQRLRQHGSQFVDIEGLLREAKALGDPDRLATAYSRRAAHYMDTGHLSEAKEAVSAALRAADGAKDPLVRPEALRIQSSILRLLGQIQDSLHICEEALEICPETKEALPERALILNNRGTLLWNMNRLTEAIEAYAEGLVIYRALGLPRYEARSLNNMGIVFASMGEHEEALAHYKSSLRIDQRLGDQQQMALKLGNIGETYVELGDREHAEGYLLKALQLCESFADRDSIVDVANSLGKMYFEHGALEKAREFLERALRLVADGAERYQEVRARVYLALVLVEEGRELETALCHGEEATALAESLAMPIGVVHGHMAQALALRGLGRLQEAVRLSRRAVEQLECVERGEARERVWWVHGTLCEQAKDESGARAAFAHAWQEVERTISKVSNVPLRTAYLESPLVRAIAADVRRLRGAGAES